MTALAILGGVQVARESVERPRVVQELLQVEQIFGAGESEGGDVERFIQAGALGTEVGYAAGDGDAGTGQDDDVPSSAK